MRAAEFIREAILYRGDASHVAQFDSAKAGYFLLYTPGTYLTDSPEVAADYTLKGSQHVVFRDDNAKDLRDLVLHYLGHLIASKTEWIKARADLTQRVQQAAYDDPAFARIMADRDPTILQDRHAHFERYQRDLRLQIEKLRSKCLAKAKKIFKAEADQLRIVQDTTKQWAIVKADREGHISRFDVPDAYLAKTLHAERPLSSKALAVLRDLWLAGRDPKITLDLRDADGRFRSFDDWIALYKQGHACPAWDAPLAGQGKGQLPDLDALWHGTHFGGSWFHDSANVARFIQAMQAIGYVGLEYDGGKRVGQHVRGGGGMQHRAFVFWDDARINGFRVATDKVTDTQPAAGLEKGARNSNRLMHIVNTIEKS